MDSDWDPMLREQFELAYWRELQDFVEHERRHHPVYPPANEVFAALQLTSLADVKVVMLGQDPYHGAGQAHGLCFSVRHGVQVPPSLRNIHRELHADLGLAIPDHGNLEAWARRGCCCSTPRSPCAMPRQVRISDVVGKRSPTR